MEADSKFIVSRVTVDSSRQLSYTIQTPQGVYPCVANTWGTLQNVAYLPLRQRKLQQAIELKFVQGELQAHLQVNTIIDAIKVLQWHADIKPKKEVTQLCVPQKLYLAITTGGFLSYQDHLQDAQSMFKETLKATFPNVKTDDYDITQWAIVPVHCHQT